MTSASLFDSFNARSLDPAQVGKSFIYSPMFSDVVARRNTAIIGPRGSGKTTFLKMLTLPALNSWRGQESARVVREIDYVAIYVPSDFTWYPEFRRAVQATPHPATDALLSAALFRSHVLLAICDTLQYLSDPIIAQNPRLARLLVPEDEARAGSLSRRLSETWDVELPIAGFFGLRRAVTKQIRQVQYWIALTSLEPMNAKELLKSCPSLGVSLFDDLRGFADEFEHEFQRPARWAACFDELEIAPTSIKAQVWQSGRSFDQRFLIKVSASPFDKEVDQIYGPKMPMPGNDFQQLSTADQTRADVDKFSRKMFDAVCRDLRVKSSDVEKILGRSMFDTAGYVDGEHAGDESHLRKAPYEVGGSRYRVLVSLASKDQSFSHYLARRSIDLTALAALSESSRAAEIRKLSPTVAIRDEFLLSHERDSSRRPMRRLRARKRVSSIYTGSRSLLAICDGNPRWLVGLLRPLIQDITTDYSAQQKQGVSRQKQAERIEKTIITFLSLLATIPLPHNSKNVTVINLIDVVGNYFLDQVLREEFNPEPVLSFTAGEGLDPGLEVVLGLAINQGAFVLSSEKAGAAKPGSIEGRDIRLTHLLAPHYKLPMVKGRSISLSRIIRDAHISDDRSIITDLFFGHLT